MSRSLRAAAVALVCAVAPAAAAQPASAGIWTEIPSGTTQNITAIEYQSSTRFWYTTAAGAIYTRQGDGSFAQTRTPSGIPLNDIEFQAGGQIGIAVGNGGQVLRSTNAGANWTAITGIPASKATGNFIDCSVSDPLGDVNSVRFAGSGRAWIFAAGSQIARSQPLDPAQVGAQGTWADGNRAGDNSCKVPSSYAEGYADAFFVPGNPDVGYIVAATFSSVFFTSNNLASAAALKPEDAGNAGSPSRVIAGDPENPSRMWSTDARDYGHSMTGYTRDGWQTGDRWKIGNDKARAFPTQGPADVDYAAGTVLAAGNAGLILNSVDGETFYYSSADGALETQRWNAVGLASATDGVIGGDNGKLAVTSQANFVPSSPPPPPPPGGGGGGGGGGNTPPPVVPLAGTSWTSSGVSGRVLVLVGGRYVPLPSGASIPLGANVDARSGSININVSVNVITGATQTATLSKGIFRVVQRRSGAAASTSISLQTPAGKARACAARKGPPKGIVRTLNGTVKGSFSIVGGAATATVRDGTWTVQDTCKGTKVKNVRGKMTVKAKSAKRAVTVKAGRTYLAKARLFAARRSGH